MVTVFLGCMALAQNQSGESLADIARANKAAQQAQTSTGAPPKVITNHDLTPDSGDEDQSAPADTMTTVSGVKKSDRYAAQRLHNQLLAQQRISAQWKSRIAGQEERIAETQSRIDRINASIQTAVGTAQYDTPANRTQAIQQERLALLKESLEEQKRSLTAMEEQARRAGANQ